MVRLIQAVVLAVTILSAACERSSSVQTEKLEGGNIGQVGDASFYNSQLAGEKTASGEALKLNDMTAASRTLPIGARLKVTNRETGQSAQVRINDRGPYAKHRVIDLTPRVAKHIGIDPKDGVAPVIVTPVVNSTTPQERE